MTNLTIDLKEKTVHLWQPHTYMGTEINETFRNCKLPEIGLTHYEVKCEDNTGKSVYLRLPVRNTNFIVYGATDELIREM